MHYSNLVEPPPRVSEGALVTEFNGIVAGKRGATAHTMPSRPDAEELDSCIAGKTIQVRGIAISACKTGGLC